ncbi:MAG: hypothetical protein JWP00_1274 [Chloroflexi bacterium]|jgi:hypothetical protein|nr:hypothetical protein [Chloroflexota bacterium]
MDIFLFVLIVLVILLLVAFTSRAGNSTGRINFRPEGMSEVEIQRLLRESQAQTRWEKGWSAKLEQTETVWPVSVTTPGLPPKVDQTNL